MQPAQPTQDAIWSVSALNFEVKTMLTRGIGTIWVEGEISNFASPASGHWYFTLKDDKAQCRAAMFRGRNSRLGRTRGLDVDAPFGKSVRKNSPHLAAACHQQHIWRPGCRACGFGLRRLQAELGGEDQSAEAFVIINSTSALAAAT